MRITDEQVVKAIREYYKEHGYAPSIRDVGKALGGLSAGSTKYRLDKLRDSGIITFDDKKPRTIKVVD